VNSQSNPGQSRAVIEPLENRTLLSAIITGLNQETPLGVFGVVNGKQTKLKVSLNSTQTATFSLTGGSATALGSPDDIDLNIPSGTTLSVTVSHGGTVVFGNVNITGNLTKFSAAAGELTGTLADSGTISNVTLGAISGTVSFADGFTNFTGGNLTGTFTSGGNVSSLKLGNISGNVNVAGNLSSVTAKTVSGTIYSAGELHTAKVGVLTGNIVSASEIASLSATGMTSAKVLAGVNLGADGLLGGIGSSADAFGAGTIDSLTVTGEIVSSFIGAGVNPVDGIFGNGNDISAGTGLIKTISAKSADDTTRFETSAFGVAKLPKKVMVATDPRFIVL